MERQILVDDPGGLPEPSARLLRVALAINPNHRRLSMAEMAERAGRVKIGVPLSSRMRTIMLLPLVLALFLPACRQVSTSKAPDRTPAFKYVEDKEGGCADIFLHKGTADDLEVLWISADKKKLNLPAKGSVSFDLATAPAGLEVAIDLWDAAPRFSAYCNDIASDTKKTATWKAKKGKVTITIGEPADPPESRSGRYKVSARLDGVMFEDDAGHQATLQEESITDAIVGWYAG